MEIDDIDADLLAVKWAFDEHSGYLRTDRTLAARTVRIHRVIFERMVGRELDRNDRVTHLDGNKANNRRSNLALKAGKELTRSVVVDSEDADLLSGLQWYESNFGYVMRKGENSETRLLHRAILERVLGRRLLASEQVDHIDRNRLNNSRSNLRIATPAQNSHNHGPRSTMNGVAPSSDYKGVSWHRRQKRWHATITKDRKRHHIGYFRSEEEAAVAYDKAARELHGEFAFLNFK